MADSDIEALSHLVALKEGWTEPRRLATVAAYEAYLDRSGSGKFERPTLDVDALWHCHILNTTSYARYCRRRFGRYVHHLACVQPDIAMALRHRLGGALPDFMAVAEPDLGLTPADPQPPNCGQPADCSAPEYRLADCGSKKKTKKKKKKKKKKVAALADCGSRQPTPMPRPIPRPPGIVADCGAAEPPPEPDTALYL